MDLISQIKPGDLVRVEPLHAITWAEVHRVILPPQPKVESYKPLDMRMSHWELYQEVRHVPVVTAGKVVHTLILPWHLSMDMTKNRIDEFAPDLTTCTG